MGTSKALEISATTMPKEFEDQIPEAEFFLLLQFLISAGGMQQAYCDIASITEDMASKFSASRGHDT